MDNQKKWITIGIIALSLLSIVAAFALGPQRFTRREERTSFARNGIGVIRIEGVIMGGTGGSTVLSGTTAGSDRISALLKEAREDDSIQAVLLRINSPGGSAPASQEIAEEVRKLRETGKTVVVSMGDVAASGGYWIAAEADQIMANPATLTGSIGVIMQTQDLQGLYDKLGIDQDTFKSGVHKDMGSSVRDITQEERRIFQSMVDDIFDQFVEVIVQGRGMSREQVLPLADGRVFTGRQALELGLVDELGNYHDAIEYTAELAGLGDNYYLHEYGKVSPWDLFFGAGIEGGQLFGGRQELHFYRQLFQELITGETIQLR